VIDAMQERLDRAPQAMRVRRANLQDIGLSAVYPLLWVFFLVAMPLPLILGLAEHRVAGLAKSQVWPFTPVVRARSDGRSCPASRRRSPA
jgi:hypothetical protein